MASGLWDERVAAHLRGRVVGQAAFTGFAGHPESWLPDRQRHSALPTPPLSPSEPIEKTVYS